MGIVLRDTSFYAEAGGQVADTGAIEGPSGSAFSVEDTQVLGWQCHPCAWVQLQQKIPAARLAALSKLCCGTIAALLSLCRCT